MDTTPICTAKSKQSGQRCRNFCTKGKTVCRIHGGKSTGPKTFNGLMRQKMGSFKHGRRSKEAKEKAGEFRSLIKQAKQLIGGI